MCHDTSYRANGLAQADSRLTAHPLYLALDANADARCAAYRALFRPELDAEAASDIREALRLGMPLGSERFVETLCARLATTFEGAYAGHTLTVSMAGITSGSTQYLDWEQKLSILERFNGRTFNTVPAGTGAVTVNLFGGTLTLLQQSYDALKASVYDRLVLQTRVKPLLDEVQLNINNGSVTFDFTALNANLNAYSDAANDGWWWRAA